MISFTKGASYVVRQQLKQAMRIRHAHMLCNTSVSPPGASAGLPRRLALQLHPAAGFVPDRYSFFCYGVLPQQNGLVRHDIFCLRTFLSLGHFHGDLLSFFQGFESFHLDCGVMHEYILTAFALDETKSLVIVEPLNGSFNSFARHNYLLHKQCRTNDVSFRRPYCDGSADVTSKFSGFASLKYPENGDKLVIPL